MKQSEQEFSLLQRAVDGDADAFGDLYETYMLEIYRYFYYRLGDIRDAEDMTETVFLRVWESLPEFDVQRASLRTWLYRVSHNLLVDRYRRPEEIESLAEVPLEAPGPDPEKSLIQAQDMERLLSALRSLKPEHQQVVLLRFVNRLSHSEAGEIMGRSEGALRVLQYRALKAMRRELGDG